MTRIPVAIAGLALAAVTAAGCGSDDGDDTTASDPGTSSAPTSPPVSDSPPASESPSASAIPTDSGDPVPSPIINKAVRAAIADGFPALVPAGVPSDWTVVEARYSPKGGGAWWIDLTDPNGASVMLMQSTESSADLVARLLPDGQPGGTVKISGTGKWTAYTGTAAAGLAKDLSDTGAVVVAPDLDVASELASELLTAEDAGNVDGG